MVFIPRLAEEGDTAIVAVAGALRVTEAEAVLETSAAAMAVIFTDESAGSAPGAV